MVGKYQISYRDVINTLGSNNQNQVHTIRFHAMNNSSQSLYFLTLTFNLNPPINASLSIKLDHNNYSIWKEQMESLIIAFDLEGFIDGLMNAPLKFLDLGKIISNPRFTN